MTLKKVPNWYVGNEVEEKKTTEKPRWYVEGNSPMTYGTPKETQYRTYENGKVIISNKPSKKTTEKPVTDYEKIYQENKGWTDSVVDNVAGLFGANKWLKKEHEKIAKTLILPKIKAEEEAKTRSKDNLNVIEKNSPFVHNVLEKAREAATMGTYVADQNPENVKTNSKVLNTIGDVTGNILGMGAGGSVSGFSNGTNMLNVTDDIAKAAGEKAALRTTSKLLPSVTRGAIDAGAGTFAQDTFQGKNMKDTLEDTIANTAGGGVLFGAGKALKEYSPAILSKIKNKGTLTKLDEITAKNEAQNTVQQPIANSTIKSGTYTVKNTALQKAQSNYDEAVKSIQNYWGHWKLDNAEIVLGAEELGINLDKILDDMATSEKNGVDISAIGDKARLSRAAGVNDSILPRLKPVVKSNKILDILTPKIEADTKPFVNVPKVTPKTTVLNESKLLNSFDNSKFIDNRVKDQLRDTSERYYTPITNKETWNKAQERVEKDLTGTLTELSNKESFTSAEDVANGLAVIDQLQKNGDYKSAAEFAESMIPKSRKLGQAVQAHAIVGRLSPEGVLNYAVKQYDKVNAQLPEGKKIKVSEDHLKELREKANVIKDMPEGRNKEIAQAQLLNDIEKPIPISLARKISTVQAMSQLLNVQTALRNILGNAGFNVAENISKLYAKPFDKAIETLKTGKSTVSTPQVNTFVKGFKEGWKNSSEELKLGVDLGGNAKYNLNETQVFKNGLLGKGEKALNYTLKVPDEAFKRGIYEESISNQLRAAGIEKPTDEMIEQAKKESLYATFQDNSLPAQILTGIKDVLNKIGIGRDIRGGSGTKTHEFGLGDLTVKYTRVPGNIISRTVEYSPLGYLKVFKILNEAKVTGNLNQRELSLTLGRATNGTSMIGIGVLMHRLGLLKSEDKDLDKDQRALDNSEGLGNYKLNLSALSRIIDNGFKAQDTKAGDILASYNWLTPVSTAFAVGAAIDNEVNKQGNLGINIGSTTVEEMLDLPTLTIIQQMFYESQKKDSNVFTMLSVPATQAVPGFVPSQLRQLSRAMDPVSRNTKSDTLTGTMINNIKNNTPMSKELLPKLSPFGQEVKNDINPLVKVLSPANVTKYNPTPVSDILKQLSKDTNNKNIFPNTTAPSTLTVNKNKVGLTQEDKFKYLKISGEEAEKQYTKILKGITLDNTSDTYKQSLTEKLEKALKVSREKAKEQILKEKGY